MDLDDKALGENKDVKEVHVHAFMIQSVYCTLHNTNSFTGKT